FTITLDDGNGGTVDRTVSVTITGTNDAPVVAATDVTGAVTEQVTPLGNLTDTGTIAFTDVDLTDAHSISPTITASAGALGALTASVTSDTTGSGLGGVITWNYSVADSDVEYLAKDQTKVETFTITLDDGNGGTVDRTVSVTITGTNFLHTVSRNCLILLIYLPHPSWALWLPLTFDNLACFVTSTGWIASYGLYHAP
ncbi:VCBS domain-containing protein, partial [Mesorhizobium sp. BR1-1-3]|uniref:VCBS domain-containing protein n=1 Tax=Mesorhizobium sp. BR1-1-3 TaxID=2876651 RepID=UPI001CD1036C